MVTIQCDMLLCANCNHLGCVMKRLDDLVDFSKWSVHHNQAFIEKSNECLQLFNQGFSYADITGILDIKEWDVRNYLIENPAFDINVERIDKKEQFFILVRHGLSHKYIAKALGHSEEVVAKFIKTFKLSEIISKKKGRIYQRKPANLKLIRLPDITTSRTELIDNQNLNITDKSSKKEKKLIIKNQVCYLDNYGFSIGEIAELYGMTNNTITVYLRKSNSITPSENDQFYALAEQGFSLQYIAKLYLVTAPVIQQYIDMYDGLNEIRALRKQQQMSYIETKICYLYKQGFSEQQIRKRLCVSSLMIANILISEQPKIDNWLEWPTDCASWRIMPEISARIIHPDQRKEEITPAILKQSNYQLTLGKNSKIRNNEILEDYKQGMTYDGIGKKYGLTRERVRQILILNPDFFEYLKTLEKEKIAKKQKKEDALILKNHNKSLAVNYPERIKEFWDYKKNGDLKPEDVAAHATTIEIWLKCPIDKHSWKKRPNDISSSWKTGARGCPTCAGKTKKPEKQPFLINVYPDFISQYWDYEKNSALGLTPENTTLCSNRKANFKCPHDGHEWSVIVGSMVRQVLAKGNTGCKECRRRKKNRAS